MKPRPFLLERFFERYEFSTKYLLCASDPESLTLNELLALEPGAGEAFGALWLGYTPSRGEPALRNAIAARYAHRDPECVLVHAGSQEPIFVFANAALQPGDHVIVQFPAYQAQYSVAQAAGVEVSRWECDLAGDGAPDPSDLARLIRPATRAIVITSPNNPTGYVVDRERLDATVALARKHGLRLFSDEVYRGSERDPGDRHLSVCDLYERGISLGGLAKAYGLAGLRIGWISTRDSEVYRAMAQFKDYTTICSAAPSEFLATLALRHHEALLARVRAIVLPNLDRLDAFFARRAGVFAWRRPRAGTTAFPRFLRGSAERFCHDLARRAGVLLLPGTVFEAGDDRVRVGYGRKNLPDALVALDAALDAID